MKTVLVTGGIASGKSEVCRYLASKGFPVYDSDSRTKALYSSVPGLKNRVEEAIGVPFKEIAVIFEDAEKRAALETVVYPEVLKDFSAWRDSQTADTVFFESAIALDKPIFASLWDEVWLVQAPLAGRLSRNPATAARLSAQKEIDPSQADVIIENDSSIEELHKKLDNLINEMKTDLSKIMSVAGKHGLYKFIALSRNNSAIGEALSDGHRTVFDAHSRITTLADIAIYTDEGEFKLKDVFLSINKALEGKEAPTSKSGEVEIKALFDKAVPNYDPDRFYFSHMKKILDWYNELAQFASFDFVEEEEEAAEESAEA
ncbi:MAG: dephospho-CoA kinase [Bacteroidales bacterium]|nr:dephospho-CoA kinase [Bacteroidales bacterium]